MGRKRVARLMRAAGLVGVSRRKWITTTVRDRNARPAPTWSTATSSRRAESAVGRRHHLHPDLGWLPVSRGRARRLQPPDRGLGDGDQLRTELVLDALNMALAQRRPAA